MIGVRLQGAGRRADLAGEKCVAARPDNTIRPIASQDHAS